jgi:hypothetical protein
MVNPTIMSERPPVGLPAALIHNPVETTTGNLRTAACAHETNPLSVSAH